MLDREQLCEFEEQGVVFPVPVLTPEEVTAYRSAAQRMQQRGTIRQPHFEHRWAYDLCQHPRVLDAAQAVLGPELLVHSTLLFYKTGGDDAFVSWHQDGLYPGLRVAGLLTAWIALTPSHPENGCLRVIPGSHRQGILPHAEQPTENNLLELGQTIDDVYEADATPVTLQAGEMSLHHRDLVHSSPSNRTRDDRIGFVVRFVGARAAHAEHAVIHARGCARLDHLELLHGPPPDQGA